MGVRSHYDLTRRHYVTEEQKRKMVKLYRQGVTQTALSQRFGVSIGTVGVILKELQVSKPDRSLTVT